MEKDGRQSKNSCLGDCLSLNSAGTFFFSVSFLPPGPRVWMRIVSNSTWTYVLARDYLMVHSLNSGNNEHPAGAKARSQELRSGLPVIEPSLWPSRA